MTIEDEMTRFTESQLESLHDRFGEFPVERTETVDDPDRFEGAAEMATNGWRGDAGVLLRDEEGRYLLIQHVNNEGEWGVPGGGHEPGESMIETARRECREETGFSCSVTDVVAARIKRIRHQNDSDRVLPMLTVWFEGVIETGEIDSSDDEVVEVQWFDEFPENVFCVLEDYVHD